MSLGNNLSSFGVPVINKNLRYIYVFIFKKILFIYF